MATINRVTGVKQVCNKLTNIEKIVPNSLQHSLQYGAVFLRDRAIDNLKGMTNTAGASKDGESITNIDKWEWVPEG